MIFSGNVQSITRPLGLWEWTGLQQEGHSCSVPFGPKEPCGRVVSQIIILLAREIWPLMHGNNLSISPIMLFKKGIWFHALSKEYCVGFFCGSLLPGNVGNDKVYEYVHPVFSWRIFPFVVSPFCADYVIPRMCVLTQLCVWIIWTASACLLTNTFLMYSRNSFAECHGLY